MPAGEVFWRGCSIAQAMAVEVEGEDAGWANCEARSRMGWSDSAQHLEQDANETADLLESPSSSIAVRPQENMVLWTRRRGARQQGLGVNRGTKKVADEVEGAGGPLAMPMCRPSVWIQDVSAKTRTISWLGSLLRNSTSRRRASARGW